MSKKYLIDADKCFIAGFTKVSFEPSDAKEVEVLDYQKVKREYEDSIFLSFIDFARSKNYLIVKIVE